jgi:Fe-S-cluster containining protein
MVAALGIDLESARGALLALYAELDARNAANTAGLELPCRRGCDACCHESVFLTPLEFLVAWEWAQAHLDDAIRDGIVDAGLALYARERERITALEAPPPDGARDHLAVARELRFRCPFLGGEGECRIHPARELYARLFGCSFNDEGGVYGCHLVGAHLGGKTVTLVSVRRAAERLQGLPLTHKRQVYPYYLQLLYGA